MAEARHSDKSPDAFRTISEVADHLDLPQHVLRFWETRFTEIKPVKRAGGRRFYRPDDVDLLRAIRHLLYSEGYTIKGVQRILKDSGTRQIQAMGADLLEGRAVVAPAKAPVAPQPSSGASRGGLLGLLPRRRERQPEPDAPEPSFMEAPPAPRAGETEPHFAEFLPGFEARPHVPPREDALRQEQARFEPPPFEDDDDEPALTPLQEPVQAAKRSMPVDEAPDVHRVAAERPVPHMPPPVRRPSRGPASRLPDTAPLPELEDPLLPFFDDDALALPVDNISEPLDARIRRLKEHAPPEGPPEEYIPARARRRAEPQGEGAARVGPLTGVFEDMDEAGQAWPQAEDDGEHFPPRPRRHGPPEQYLPPHLRSEPRLAAAPVHAPQPVLSRDDVHRLQATLYELGECRRLLTATLDADA